MLLWFHLKEGMCLGQLQESVVQKSYKQTSMPSSPCWGFFPITGDTWAGLVKLGDGDLPEHPWAV